MADANSSTTNYAEIRRVVREELQIRGVNIYSRTQELIRGAASDVSLHIENNHASSPSLPINPQPLPTTTTTSAATPSPARLHSTTPAAENTTQ